MKGKGVWKKAAVFAMAVFGLWLLYPGLFRESGAKTDLGMEEFEEIIGTYNIDDSIPNYKNYVEQYKTAVYPRECIEIEATMIMPWPSSCSIAMTIRRSSPSA